MFDLKGKVGLVTGAASGIGFAYVQELLRNEVKGVGLIDLDATKGLEALNELVREFGNNCAIFVKADVSDRVQFEDAFKAIVKAFGQLDIVINNAGILQELQWEKCIAVNLLGVVNGSMLAMNKYLPQYRSGFEGVIVNTASVAGVTPFECNPIYCATKFGVVGLTRAMGGDLHYKTSQVRILAICPGGTDTPILNITEKQLSEPYLSTMRNTVKNAPKQKVDSLARNVIDLIRNAPNGSIWLGVSDKCTKAEFPTYF